MEEIAFGAQASKAAAIIGEQKRQDPRSKKPSELVVVLSFLGIVPRPDTTPLPETRAKAALSPGAAKRESTISGREAYGPMSPSARADPRRRSTHHPAHYTALAAPEQQNGRQRDVRYQLSVSRRGHQ